MSKFETGNYYNALSSSDDEKIAVKVERKTKRAAAEQFLIACVNERGLLTAPGNFFTLQDGRLLYAHRFFNT